MRIATTAAFREFLAKNGVFPFKELSLTRGSIKCKWLLLRSSWRGIRGVLGVEVQYFPVLTSTLPSNTVLELIMNEDALPLTPLLAEIMDSMFIWGNGKSSTWYNDTVELFAYLLEDGINNKREDLMRAQIGLYVDRALETHVTGDIQRDMIWHNWKTYFTEEVYNAGTPYFDIALNSIAYANWAIAQHNYNHPVPLPEVVNSE